MIIDLEPQSYHFTLAWETAISKADDGSEQRAAIELVPRLDIFAELLPDEEWLRDLRLAVWSAPTATHQMPLWHREFHTIGLPSGNDILVPPDAIDCLPVGGQVLLLNVDQEPALFTIVDVDPNGGNYDVELSGTPSSLLGTRVLPLMDVYLRDNQTTGRWRLNDIGRWNVETVGKTFYETMAGGSPGVEVFNNYLLLDRSSSVGNSDTLAEQHQGMVQGLEDRGFVVPTTTATNGDIAREARFAWHTAADRQFWFDFLYQVQGRLKPFITPTWRRDLIPNMETLGDPGPFSNLDIQGTPDFTEWWASSSHKCLAIVFTDGTFVPVRITKITPDGDDFTMETANDWENPDELEIAYISFLEVVRLAEDKVDITYQNGIGRFDLPLVTIQDDQAWHPQDAAEAYAAAGERGTWVTAYNFDEAASENIEDIIGSIDLAPSSTPEYRAAGPLPAKQGRKDYAVRFTSGSTDAFVAASNATFNLGTTGSIAIYTKVRFHTTILNRNFVSKYGGSSGWGFQLQSFPTGQIIAFVNGSALLFSTIAVDHWQSNAGNWHDILFCVDRESATPRLQIFSELGQGAATDITSAGNIDTTSFFRVGAPDAAQTTCACDIAYMAVATSGVAAIRSAGMRAVRAFKSWSGLAA